MTHTQHTRARPSIGLSAPLDPKKKGSQVTFCFPYSAFGPPCFTLTVGIQLLHRVPEVRAPTCSLLALRSDSGLAAYEALPHRSSIRLCPEMVFPLVVSPGLLVFPDPYHEPLFDS